MKQEAIYPLRCLKVSFFWVLCCYCSCSENKGKQARHTSQASHSFPFPFFSPSHSSNSFINPALSSFFSCLSLVFFYFLLIILPVRLQPFLFSCFSLINIIYSDLRKPSVIRGWDESCDLLATCLLGSLSLVCSELLFSLFVIIICYIFEPGLFFCGPFFLPEGLASLLWQTQKNEAVEIYVSVLTHLFISLFSFCLSVCLPCSFLSSSVHSLKRTTL